MLLPRSWRDTRWRFLAEPAFGLRGGGCHKLKCCRMTPSSTMIGRELLAEVLTGGRHTDRHAIPTRALYTGWAGHPRWRLLRQAEAYETLLALGRG